MSRIFWDTNLFIYLLEDYGELSAKVCTLRQRMLERRDQLCTSTLTLGEILVKPAEAGRREWADRYETALAPPAVLLVSFDRACAKIYAQLRRDQGIRPPDAIQLSCAAQAKCDLFITNDERLSRKVFPGIQFIVSLDRAYL